MLDIEHHFASRDLPPSKCIRNRVDRAPGYAGFGKSRASFFDRMLADPFADDLLDRLDIFHAAWNVPIFRTLGEIGLSHRLAEAGKQRIGSGVKIDVAVLGAED